jgi:hypothetical protein
LPACSGNDGGTPSTTVPPTGTVSGQVVSAANGSAVAGASVTTTAGSTTSAANGSFTVAAAVGDRAVVHVEATGFAEAFPVARVTAGRTTNLGVRLVPTGVVTPVTIATGGIVTVPNSTAWVDLPPNGLIPKTGGAAAGTVNVALTPINPAVDVNLMPGDFNGISAGGGSPVPIESFGALLIDIRDNSGTRYTLAPGKTATIRIPLGTLSPAPPATIPLFFFDEDTGLWREEGTATLRGTATNRYYEGTVTRFSYWNADQVFDTVFISGCVRDTNDQPVGNLLVETIGINYSGRALVVTASDGTFRVGMRRSSLATLSAIEFNLQTFTSQLVTNVVPVGPSLVDFTVPDCLVKGATPLTITTSATLPGGKVGIAYNQTLAATGGILGYSWSLNPGSSPLPVGVSLNPSGVISGVPTTAGKTMITIKVTDSAAGTATKQLSLTISRVGVPFAITSLSPLPEGTAGTAYAVSLTTSDGTPPLSWSVVSGALPVGVTLNPSTGQLSGTPTTPGTSTFTIRVQDSETPQQSDQKPFTLPIISSGGGGGGGTLTVTNAPSDVGGTFVANQKFTNVAQVGLGGIITWVEGDISGFPIGPFETLQISVEQTNDVSSVLFEDGNTGAVTNKWFCTSIPIFNAPCQGVVTVNRSAGTAVFSDVVIPLNSGPTALPITLNGTLKFTPF